MRGEVVSFGGTWGMEGGAVVLCDVVVFIDGVVLPVK